ncbi:MAG: bifunctional DNA primase/polymerase, partial [bacterium]
MIALATAALEYAARGWPVLPIRPRAKLPLTEHGLHDATTDPELITQWWERWPDANIGIRTGVA